VKVSAHELYQWEAKYSLGWGYVNWGLGRYGWKNSVMYEERYDAMVIKRTEIGLTSTQLNQLV